MTEDEIGWSLFIKTLYEIYEILDELCLEENVNSGRKKELSAGLTNRYEKLALIAKVAKVKQGKNWKLPIILRTEGNG